jgi:hypothetical protein
MNGANDDETPRKNEKFDGSLHMCPVVAMVGPNSLCLSRVGGNPDSMLFVMNTILCMSRALVAARAFPLALL